MKFETTLGKIKSFGPCADGWKSLCKTLGNTDDATPVTLLQILDSNGVEDAYWALRCWDYRDYCLLLADVIDPAVTGHSCDAVRHMPSTIRKWHAGEITDSGLDAARDAAWAAVRDAAWDAARGAAWDAARAAARAAAWDEAWDAAWAAARGVSNNTAWMQNEKLMREFIAEMI